MHERTLHIRANKSAGQICKIEAIRYHESLVIRLVESLTMSDHTSHVLSCKIKLCIIFTVTLLFGISDRSIAQIQFTDVSSIAGVENSPTLTESLAWGDYDNDGDEDLYLTNDGKNSLMRNDGGFNFTDVTDEAGVGSLLWGVGSAFADLDNDGDLDLYVVNFGTGPDQLYENLGPNEMGVYSFQDIAAAAGISFENSSRGMAYLDANNDGLLDIYVNAIGDDLLYINQGDLEFTEMAAQFGLQFGGLQGVGVVCTDVTDDGLIDIFVGNRSFETNRLYINNGEGFDIDEPNNFGITSIGFGMGVISFDYDNDLDFDLYWTTWPGENNNPNCLYRNDGGSFTDVAATAGVTDPLGWGISANTGDIDNDGWVDFFVTNGFSDNTTPNVLFRNNGDGTFSDVTATIGGGNFDGRGVAFADVDNDGDLDMCVTADRDLPTKLWRNDTNNNHHWLTVKLTGATSNRSAVGARVQVNSGSNSYVKEVSSGAGRGSYNSLPVEFGLGNGSDPVSITINWPSGIQQNYPNVSIDQIASFEEPLLGDVDRNGTINLLDILPFVNVLVGGSYQIEADLNIDNTVNLLDVEPFVETLAQL